MTAKEKFLTQRQRYQPVTLPQDFSDEEMARDWTLSEADKKEVNKNILTYLGFTKYDETAGIDRLAASMLQ